MLVLNMGKGEIIYIGDDVEIIHGGYTMQGETKLIFKAPRHINIIRKEVIDKLLKQAEKIREEKINGK